MKYTLLNFNDKEITYKNDTGATFSENFNDFFIQNLWLYLDEKDKKKLAKHVEYHKGPASVIETFTIPFGGICFSTIYGYKLLPVIVIFMAACLLVPQFIGAKWVHILGLTENGGFLVFTLSYLFIDLINEVFGYKQAKTAVYSCILAMLFMAVMLQLSLMLPNASRNMSGIPSEVYESVYHPMPVHLAVEGIALLISNMLNIFVFQLLKSVTREKALWLRSIVSNCLGQLVNTTIFLFLMYGCFISWRTLELFSTQALYLALLTPVLYLLVHFVRNFQLLWFYTGPEKCHFEK